MSTLYAQNKSAWHLDRIESLRQHKTPVPVHVQLVIADVCNHGCTFCSYRRDDGLSTELFWDGDNHNPNRKIATEKAIEILDDCAAMGVKAIQFTGGGEPTVHKDHLPIFWHAQSLGLKTALVTNGIRLTTDHANLAHAWVRVSVDAGTEETYCNVRQVPPLHWRKVWENIGDFAKAYRGVLGVGFVVTNENYAELSACAALAKAAGATSIRVGALFSAAGLSYYENLPAIRESIARAVSEHGEFIVNLFERRMDDLADGSPKEKFCGYQYFTTYIGGDLNVYRCCNTAYTKAGLLGSVKDQRFRDLVPALAPFDARGCRFCQFGGQNKAIAALLDEPTHAEFV